MLDETPRTFVGTTTFSVIGVTNNDERDVAAEIRAIDGVDIVTIDAATGEVAVTAFRPVDRVDIARAVAKAGHAIAG